MREELKNSLEAAGIDTEEVMGRLMQNEGLLLRLMGRFLEDKNYGLLVKAMEAGNREEALMASHTMKGVCGNLSIKKLFSLFSRQVEAMRAGDWEEAEGMMGEITYQYEAVSAAVRTVLQENGK